MGSILLFTERTSLHRSSLSAFRSCLTWINNGGLDSPAQASSKRANVRKRRELWGQSIIFQVRFVYKVLCFHRFHAGSQFSSTVTRRLRNRIRFLPREEQVPSSQWKVMFVFGPDYCSWLHPRQRCRAQGPLACWDCGFESRWGHGCLSLVSVVCCVRSGPFVGLITRPEASYLMRCVWVWSCSLDNERTIAHYGLSRHRIQCPLQWKQSYLVSLHGVTFVFAHIQPVSFD
jgi:hypothetical protein